MSLFDVILSVCKVADFQTTIHCLRGSLTKFTNRNLTVTENVVVRRGFVDK